MLGVHADVRERVGLARVLEQEPHPVARPRHAGLHRREQREIERLERDDLVERDVEVGVPRQHVALRVEARLEVHAARRALRRARGLVGARPLHAHRLADRLRDQRRVGGGVLGAVAAVAASTFYEYEADCFPGQAGDRRKLVLHGMRGLGRGPHRELAVLEVGYRARRADRRVRLDREVVARLDAPRARFERALRVACGLRDLFLRHREPAPVVEHARLVGERGTGPPVHSHRPRRLDSGPFAARDHGEEVFLAHGLNVAVHLARLGEVDLLDARLVEVGADDARMQHPGHAHVVDVGELAGDLAGNVDPPDRFPDQAVVGALLERDLRIDGNWPWPCP